MTIILRSGPVSVIAQSVCVCVCVCLQVGFKWLKQTGRVHIRDLKKFQAKIVGLNNINEIMLKVVGATSSQVKTFGLNRQKREKKTEWAERMYACGRTAVERDDLASKLPQKCWKLDCRRQTNGRKKTDVF